MSITATVIAGCINVATTEGDAATARTALVWATRAASAACAVTMLVIAPWYAGWLLALIAALCLTLLSLFIQGAVSDDKFAALGGALGSATARVRGLFSKQAAA